MDKYKQKSDAQLVQMYADGDPDASNALLSRHKDAVRITARKYYMLGGDQDDIIQEGMIGLFKAIQSYDPNGGASFKTYRNICVRNQILNAIQASAARQHEPLNSAVSLDEISSGEDGTVAPIDQGVLTDISANPAELAIYRDTMRLMLSEDSKLLSPLEKQVARKLAAGKTYREVAAELDRSPKSIDNTIQRIKRKLKDFFE